VVSWEAMKRQSRRSPERMTALLIKAFAAKMVFFGLYTAALLKLGTLRPVAFVTSLLSYFISLHILEAIGLRRLEGSHCSPPPVLEETDRCGS